MSRKRCAAMMVLSLLMFVSTANAQQDAAAILTAKPAENATQKIMTDLYSAIGRCTPYQASEPHPLMKNERITMQVYGIENEKCKFTQTLPNHGLQTCFFNEKQREEIHFRKLPALQTAMQDTNTCKITGY